MLGGLGTGLGLGLGRVRFGTVKVSVRVGVQVIGLSNLQIIATEPSERLLRRYREPIPGNKPRISK